MRARFDTVELSTTVPFRISRGTTTTTENVVVALEHDGETGYGAAAPSRYYGETTESVEARLPALFEVVEAAGDPYAPRTIHDELCAVAADYPAARAAVDVALWDLAGKLLDAPVYRILGLSADPEGCPPTSFTVGLAETSEMERGAREAAAAGYPVLKVKLGTNRDLAIVEAIREAAPDVRLRVDANESWDVDEAVRKCEALSAYDVEFVEQPVAASDPDGLLEVHERSPIPIAVDESCLTADDVPAVADRCDVVTLKLMKTGGLTPALDLVATARAHGLEVMCGCMLETNASIAAAAHLLPMVEYADLDGSLLLESDPYAGVQVSQGRFDLASVERGTGAEPE